MHRWQKANSYFWEEAPFFRLLLPFITGIIIYDQHSLNLGIGPIFSSILVCFLVLISLYFSYRGNNLTTGIRLLATCTLLISTGWAVSFFQDVRNDKSWFGNFSERAEAFTARIVEDPVEKERTWKLKVSLTNALTKGSSTNCKGEALMYLYKNEKPITLKRGDVIFLPSGWQEISNSGNPFEFDYAKFARRQNLHYQQFLSADEITVYRSPVKEENSFIDKTHDYAKRQLEYYLKDKATLGIVEAMLLGDKDNLEEDLRQSYAETGIVHIIAISGTHVGMFFLLVSGLFFWIKKKRHWLKYFLAIPLIWMYVLIAGAPVSAIRAAVMFSMLGVGLSFQRNSNPLNTIFAAAFFMLLLQPMWLFSAGFQLSFTAVLSLILFFNPVRQLFTPINAILRNLWMIIAASIAAEILIAPLVIYYYHLLPSAFILANVFAYVFMFIMLAGGLLIICFSKIMVAAKLFAAVLTHVVAVFNVLVTAMQQWNPVSFSRLCLSGLGLFLLYLLIAGLGVYLIKRRTAGLMIALSSLCLFLFVSIYREWRMLKQEKVIVYNLSRKNYVEHVKGEYFTVLSEDLPTAKEKAITEAHINLGAWSNRDSDGQEIIHCGDKSFLVLNQPWSFKQTKFPVDYILIRYPVKDFSALQLREVFQFKKLVLGSNQKGYIAERWKDSCIKYGIPMHATQLDGAFVVPAAGR